MIPHLSYYAKPFSSYSHFKSNENARFALSFTIGGPKIEYEVIFGQVYL